MNDIDILYAQLLEQSYARTKEAFIRDAARWAVRKGQDAASWAGYRGKQLAEGVDVMTHRPLAEQQRRAVRARARSGLTAPDAGPFDAVSGAGPAPAARAQRAASNAQRATPPPLPPEAIQSPEQASRLANEALQRGDTRAAEQYNRVAQRLNDEAVAAQNIERAGGTQVIGGLERQRLINESARPEGTQVVNTLEQQRLINESRGAGQASAGAPGGQQVVDSASPPANTASGVNNADAQAPAAAGAPGGQQVADAGEGAADAATQRGSSVWPYALGGLALGGGAAGAGGYYYGQHQGQQEGRRQRNMAFGAGLAAGTMAPNVVNSLGSMFNGGYR